MIAFIEKKPATKTGIKIRGELKPSYEEILTPEALNFLSMLHRRFEKERRRLLELRKETQQKLDEGYLPEFPPETAHIRQSEWQIAPIPPDLQDRRVEITGPVERKMIINALNSGANVFMADFEDATSPTWDNLLAGQINLRDAVNGTISFFDVYKRKEYQLKEKTAVLMVRPRGWHLLEEHLLIDGEPIAGALFDFGLYFWHNAQNLVKNGTGPYFYLPKLENRHEASLWNQVFLAAQETLGLKVGTIKATVLIETILASFELDEILYSLKDHVVGLNCGRWDYIFSVIKKFRQHPEYVFPDRSLVTMTTHLMRSYSLLVIKTCHRRGASAIGGMAAQIPIKDNFQANEKALAKVRADKEREVNDGHDGTWVAHPGLVAVAKQAFDQKMPQANQISRQRDDVQITAQDLLTIPEIKITAQGLRQNIRVAILYLSSWLDGIGCVPLDNLMEDAATAEICRSQLWQWLHHGAKLEDGRVIDLTLFNTILDQEIRFIRQENGHQESKLRNAIALLINLVTGDKFEEFLTLPAYRQIVNFVRS
jgi:malate synthase